MKPSKLRQVLIAFEETNGALSLPQLAQDLEVSQDRLDGMIQHWVRKGKIRQTKDMVGCGTCGDHDSCGFVVELPKSYELAPKDGAIPLNVLGTSCSHKSKD